MGIGKRVPEVYHLLASGMTEQVLDQDLEALDKDFGCVEKRNETMH